jgi:hypothetical protein
MAQASHQKYIKGDWQDTNSELLGFGLPEDSHVQ